MAGAKGPSSTPVYLRYGGALLFTALATLVRLYLMGHAGPRLNYTPFLVAVALTCWYAGTGPAALATVLGLLIGFRQATDIAISRPGGYLIGSVIIIVAIAAQRRARQRLQQETAERLRLEEEEKRERQ